MSQMLHWYGLSPVCILWCLTNVPLSVKYLSHYCIDIVYPLCLFYHVLPGVLSMQNISQIGSIDMVYPQCVFSGAVPLYISLQNICHTCYIYHKCYAIIVKNNFLRKVIWEGTRKYKCRHCKSVFPGMMT